MPILSESTQEAVKKGRIQLIYYVLDKEFGTVQVPKNGRVIF